MAISIALHFVSLVPNWTAQLEDLWFHKACKAYTFAFKVSS